jgi:flagellar L-ring protein precursor FlgH
MEIKGNVCRAVRWVLLLALLPIGIVVAGEQEPGPRAYSNLGQRPRLTLAETSFYYRPPPPEPRELEMNDLVVVLVDEKSRVISEGEMDRRKKADGAFVLKDWITLDGLNLQPDSQAAGEPSVTGEMQSKYRAESELETRDSMTFRIACRVVDIRPNGHLLIEGRRSIRNNSDTWEMSLFGTIRAEDVMPNNTVLSEHVADLRITKRETGHVRDGYRRGWFTRWFDRFQPF